MPAQGRKNVHGKAGVRFKAAYTTSKDNNMLRNVTSELIIYGKLTVGSKVARQVQVRVEKLITLAKRGDLHSRRLAAARLRDGILNDKGQSALTVLFSDLAPKFQARKGGYTRVLKLGNRRGDDAPIALIEFVE